MAAHARGCAVGLRAAARSLAAWDDTTSQRWAMPSCPNARPSSRVVASRRGHRSPGRAWGMTCAPSVRGPGMRGLKPSVARGAAGAAGDRVASAPSSLGVGARAKAALRASARSVPSGVSDVLSAPRWLTRGPPPSGDTRSAQTPCCQSGRCALASPWVMARGGVALAETAWPLRDQRVVSRCWQRGARRSWAQPASAHALNHRSPPEAWTASGSVAKLPFRGKIQKSCTGKSITCESKLSCFR